MTKAEFGVVPVGLLPLTKLKVNFKTSSISLLTALRKWQLMARFRLIVSKIGQLSTFNFQESYQRALSILSEIWQISK